MNCQHENCRHCSRCGGSLLLTPIEAALLEQLAQTPFLPVGKGLGELPVYLEDNAWPAEDYGRAILALDRKGLVRLDTDVPLQGFDYTAYERCPLHGSFALTAKGQDVVELIQIQGFCQEEDAT